MAIISTLNDPDNFEYIHPLNRVQLVKDSLSFSKKGDLDYSITFQLLNYLKHENQYTPWLSAMKGLKSIGKLMERTQKQGIFQVSRITLILFIC